MASIESTVRSEIHDFIHNPITVVDGYEFNQYENVKKTHLYLNSRFYKSGNSQTDEPLVDGIESAEEDRIFFNVTLPRVRAVKRFFDIDLADIVLDEIDPQSEMAIQFLNKEFDRFANMQGKYDQTLSADLNGLRDPLLEYGTLILKIGENKRPEVVPLQRYFVDPTVKRSKDSRFNTIKHTMTPAALRAKVKDGWDSEVVEALIDAHADKANASNSYEDDGGVNKIVSSSLIDVYERYGWLAHKEIYGGENETEIMTLTLTGFGPDSLKKGKKEDEEIGVLYKTGWKKEVPIIDHHLFKTHGRFQGIGIVELLYPIQQRMNEVANQKRISMEMSAIHLFQTADPGMLNNILSDLENGDVIQSKRGDLTPVANEERNLAAFDSEIVTYQTQGDKLSFANDLLSGGDVPSSTPATNVVVQNNNQVLVHLEDKERFTTFVADNYIKTHVVPALIKEMDDEHFLRIVSNSSDLLQIDEKMVDVQMWEAIKEGKVLDKFQEEDMRNDLMKKLRSSGPNRYVKVMKGYYKDKINDVLVLIGNEKKDVAKIASNTMSFFQMLQNPAVLSDPVMRVFATNYGREIGIDTAQLELAFAKRDAMPQQEPEGGGKMPKPAEEEKADPALANVL